MYKTNVSVCPQTIFNVKSVGENTTTKLHLGLLQRLFLDLYVD